MFVSVNVKFSKVNSTYSCPPRIDKFHSLVHHMKMASIMRIMITSRSLLLSVFLGALLITVGVSVVHVGWGGGGGTTLGKERHERNCWEKSAPRNTDSELFGTNFKSCDRKKYKKRTKITFASFSGKI